MNREKAKKKPLSPVPAGGAVSSFRVAQIPKRTPPAEGIIMMIMAMMEMRFMPSFILSNLNGPRRQVKPLLRGYFPRADSALTEVSCR